MVATELLSARGSVATMDSVLIPLQFSGDFLEWALLFFVLALVAAAIGARGITGISMTVAKWLVVLFIVLAVISLLL